MKARKLSKKQQINKFDEGERERKKTLKEATNQQICWRGEKERMKNSQRSNKSINLGEERKSRKQETTETKGN